MRSHYLSDLHLEAQGFQPALPKGDILIIAGDLCNASCLDQARADKYHTDQRSRVMRFLDAARTNFAHVLLVAGNHEFYGSTFDDVPAQLRYHLPGVTVLDNETVEIDGVRFFGTTLWTDFERRSKACLDAISRRIGDFFFIKTRALDPEHKETLRRFQPRDALKAFDRSLAAVAACVASAGTMPVVVISHHPPSLKGLNPRHAGNGLDGAYASDLDAMIAGWDGPTRWVHGHTHIRRTYRIGSTAVHANCRGFDGKDASARSFSARPFFDL